jgi:hypothetical protein
MNVFYGSVYKGEGVRTVYSVQLLPFYILQCIAVIILNVPKMNFERIICVDLKLLLNTSGTIVPFLH